MFVDVFTAYMVSMMPIYFTDEMFYVLMGFNASILLLYLMSSREKPVLINFLAKTNPKPEFVMNFDEEGELVSVRFLATKLGKSMAMIITCVTIMAVDYPLLFPRQLCKTENDGWSFMDSGVALVMIFSGATNPLVVK